MKKYQIDEINRHHQKKIDKMFLKTFNLSSKLIEYKNHIIYLVIKVPHNWHKSGSETALSIGWVWKREHPALFDAERVAAHVVFQNSKNREVANANAVEWFRKEPSSSPEAKIPNKLRTELRSQLLVQRN